jgi:hypothetical protein
LIAAYTRFLMHGVPVYDIKNAHNTLKEMYPGTPVWSEITAARCTTPQTITTPCAGSPSRPDVSRGGCRRRLRRRGIDAPARR